MEKEEEKFQIGASRGELFVSPWEIFGSRAEGWWADGKVPLSGDGPGQLVGSVGSFASPAVPLSVIRDGSGFLRRNDYTP